MYLFYLFEKKKNERTKIALVQIDLVVGLGHLEDLSYGNGLLVSN